MACNRILGFTGQVLPYPVLRCIWLRILADPSKTIEQALVFQTIGQTSLSATA
jgi:hypothetical protein